MNFFCCQSGDQVEFFENTQCVAYGARMVQKTESLLSSCLTIVEIEHTAKAFAAINRIIA